MNRKTAFWFSNETGTVISFNKVSNKYGVHSCIAQTDCTSVFNFSDPFDPIILLDFGSSEGLSGSGILLMSFCRIRAASTGMFAKIPVGPAIMAVRGACSLVGVAFLQWLTCTSFCSEGSDLLKGNHKLFLCPF